MESMAHKINDFALAISPLFGTDNDSDNCFNGREQEAIGLSEDWYLPCFPSDSTPHTVSEM